VIERASVMSATVIGTGRSSRLRTSVARTVSPRAWRARTRCAPTNPPAPVTREVVTERVVHDARRDGQTRTRGGSLRADATVARRRSRSRDHHARSRRVRRRRLSFSCGVRWEPVIRQLFEACARLGGRTRAALDEGEHVVDTPLSSCSVCERKFEVRFRYQVREDASGFVYFCSQVCQQRSLAGGVERGERVTPGPTAAPAAVTRPRPSVRAANVVVPRPSAPPPSTTSSAGDETSPAANSAGCACDVCGKRFQFEFPFQVSVSDRGAAYYCTMACRSAARAGVSGVSRAGANHGSGPRRIAVFNHKGGTGKTTTAVNLAAGLAESGQPRACSSTRTVRATSARASGSAASRRSITCSCRASARRSSGHPGAPEPRRAHVERDARRRGAPARLVGPTGIASSASVSATASDGLRRGRASTARPRSR
jgi:hypothetical protein